MIKYHSFRMSRPSKLIYLSHILIQIFFQVIFTKAVRLYKELDKSLGVRFLFDRKFKIVFESADLQNAYNKLLAHVCSKCPGRHAFPTYVNLRDHMRKEHELFYCDLCVDNLKVGKVC